MKKAFVITLIFCAGTTSLLAQKTTKPVTETVFTGSFYQLKDGDVETAELDNGKSIAYLKDESIEQFINLKKVKGKLLFTTRPAQYVYDSLIVEIMHSSIKNNIATYIQKEKERYNVIQIKKITPDYYLYQLTIYVKNLEFAKQTPFYDAFATPLLSANGVTAYKKRITKENFTKEAVLQYLDTTKKIITAYINYKKWATDNCCYFEDENPKDCLPYNKEETNKEHQEMLLEKKTFKELIAYFEKDGYNGYKTYANFSTAVKKTYAADEAIKAKLLELENLKKSIQ